MNITHHSNPGYLMCFIQAEKTWKWLREASQTGGFCRRLVIVYVINDTKTAFVISVYEFISKDAEILFFFFVAMIEISNLYSTFCKTSQVIKSN